jgi:hypothetical protein
MAPSRRVRKCEWVAEGTGIEIRPLCGAEKSHCGQPMDRPVDTARRVPLFRRPVVNFVLKVNNALAAETWRMTTRQLDLFFEGAASAGHRPRRTMIRQQALVPASLNDAALIETDTGCEYRRRTWAGCQNRKRREEWRFRLRKRERGSCSTRWSGGLWRPDPSSRQGLLQTIMTAGNKSGPFVFPSSTGKGHIRRTGREGRAQAENLSEE